MNRDEGGLLRIALRINAIATSASGVAFLVGGQWLGPIFGLAPMVLRALGLGFVIFAAHAWVASRRRAISRAEALYFVAADAAYVAASAAVLFLSPPLLTLAGRVVFGLMADVVFLFAIAEYVGMRRLSRAVPAAA